MLKKLVIIGGYGNGTVAASTVEDINTSEKVWDILGFLNDYEQDPINGHPVLGKISSEVVSTLLRQKDVYFLYTLISTKLNYKFLNKLLELKVPEERFATIVHPTAVVSKYAKLGYGVCVQPLVNIGPNVTIGNHVQIFAQAMIGHNSKLENYSYVANNACVGANVNLCEGAYLGTNCSILENVIIGKWALVGIGSVVIRNVNDYTKVVGNPAREIGKVE